MAEIKHRVNGVFKGGGAKGTAYAGALQAFEEQGLWFESVAGASAGAITATLVAAGYSGSDIATLAPKALQAVRSNVFVRLGKAAIGQTTSIFDSVKLRDWINDRLQEQTGLSGSVTFRQLVGLKGIELYVVTMDLASGTPIVFSRRTTPDVEVAAAVAASSAIPGAFPPGRAALNDPTHGAVVHQLVDGGSWANYPAFVFKDRSFRDWVSAEATHNGFTDERERTAFAAEAQRPTVGFVLGEPRQADVRDVAKMLDRRDPKPVSKRFDVGPTYTSPDPGQFAFGSLFGSDWVRLFLGVAMAIWLVISVVLFPVAVRRISAWSDSWVPDWAYPFALVGSLSILVLVAVGAILGLVALIALSRIIADTVIPSAKAAMSVATDVPPWVGRAGDDVVVRVPHGALTTTGFVITDALREEVVRQAHQDVQAQLSERAQAGKLWEILGEPLPPAVNPIPVPPAAATHDRSAIVGFVIAAIVAGIIGVLGWATVNTLANLGGWWRVSLFAVVVLAGIGGGLWYVSRRTGLRASSRARLGVTSQTMIGLTRARIYAALGVVLIVVGFVVAGAAMSHRNDTVASARVVSGESVNGEKTYVLSNDERVTTNRNLRIGETVYVQRRGDGTWKLTGPLPGARFPLAIALTAFGLGLLTSAIKWFAWKRRCVRLVAAVSGG